MTFRQNCGEDRVWFHDNAGSLRSVPTSWTDARIVKKLDLAENTRYCQASFEDAMPDVTRRFLGDVMWRCAPVRATWSSAAIVLRFHTDRIL